MGNTWTVFRREMSSYFTSPIAYIFVLVFLVLMGVYFFLIQGFFRLQNPDLRSYFVGFLLAFVLLVPAVTMRLWSEEKKSGTIELLMTLPFRSWQVVLGKYLAGYSVVLLTLLLTLVTPISVSWVLDLDWGVIWASYLGAALMAAVYLAVGAWASSLTENQIVALLVAMVFLLLLFGAGLPPVVDVLNKFWDGFGDSLGWFGTFGHYQEFTKGLVNPVGVLYALSMTAFFLILNNFAVEWRKY